MYGDDGYVYVYGISVVPAFGVRPALKLNLESVIFSSESKTFTVGSAASYSVTVTAGSNLTKTETSGEASQTGLSGAMTAVVYTANDGYYFPENYSVESVNGIAVTRDSYTQITVSGTPSADAEITLTAPTAKTTPDAPTTASAMDCTTVDNNDGKLTGVTAEMEYKKSDATSWTAGSGSDITGLIPGTYHVRVKATDTANASAIQELTIEEYSAPTYDVTITPGSNMTKTEASGAASQTDLSGAMADVVYTANDGYYFPENYSVESVNGIAVTRDSYTQITVSGTPTADAAFTLTAPTAKTTPDAPTTATAVDCTTADNNDGKLTGVTTAMEYQKSGDTSWTAGTDSDITGLVPGTYYVRVKATDTTNASGNQELTIAEYVAPTYDVTITAGDNMTKTEASGAASQTDLSGEMADVAYTANDGYYFPENYSVESVNGISVTRDSYTQITVSGTPTADAAITLTAPTAKTTPDAPTTATAVDCTTADNNDGKLTGLTTAMEYQKSGDTSWTAGTDSDITGLVPGTYYVRVKATDTTNASGNQELTIKGFVSYIVTFKVVNGAWNDGTNADKTVTLTGWEGDKLMLTSDQIPRAGSKPYSTYKFGNWDVTPSADTEITEDTTYTYTYVKKNSINSTVTFKVVNGSWNDGTTEDKTVTLRGYQGETLKLAAKDIPEAGSKAAEGYQEGSWDVTPAANTVITDDVTYTYTYAKKETEPENPTPEPIPGPEPEEGVKLEREADGSLVYYKDGEAQTNENGLVPVDDAWVYVEAGVVAEEKSGFVDYDGGSFLIVKGFVESGANGLVEDPDHPKDWYFLSNGQVQTQYTGLAEYGGKWFYIENGKLDVNLAAFVEYDGGLFFVGAGRIMTEVNGLAMDPQGTDWYYLANGQAQLQYTGLVQYDGEWFYVVNGKLATDYTGSVEYDGAEFNVVSGMV
ncbi:MAG: hypothetical protein J6N53_04895, partial [Lachnospiraceae bacterium]|nr:hypothetical protein [Lachnospiraceae bacterium]